MVVKQNGRTVNDLVFDKGPVYIGRQEKNQVFLNNAAVSRQHAVIFNTQDSQWTVEDLDSANKTYLNDRAIHKADIKTGDCLRIIDYIIEINLDGQSEKPATRAVEPPVVSKVEPGKADDAKKTDKPARSEDTLAAPQSSSGPQVIERRLDTTDAPPVRLPAHRAMDLLQANEAIGKAGNIDELLLALLDTTSKQLGTYHNWCALRSGPDGPMTFHAGRTRQGQALDLNTIKFNEKINEAIEKRRFLLFIFSKDMTKDDKGQIRSVVIAPIIGPAGCFGVLYANNTFRDDHYSLSDLDYLMLLGMHIASAVQKITNCGY
ncbi:MAG: FHA domain-containing protein [Phycisphaerae bacterium]|nr:FHA domain-containing protein [Phycisphaerae bacterium]